jgi:hypothetical protein
MLGSLIQGPLNPRVELVQAVQESSSVSDDPPIGFPTILLVLFLLHQVSLDSVQSCLLTGFLHCKELGPRNLLLEQLEPENCNCLSAQELAHALVHG